VTTKIIAYASSERLNALLSAAQYENALPKNRTEYSIPLVAKSNLDKAEAERDVLLAQNEWLKDRLSDLQLPATSKKNIEEWLVECGMPARAALNGEETV
jgi:hypothetical protein